MNVKRMLLLAGMALAIVAFTAPATAGAVVQLKKNGVPLAAGDPVTATSVNLPTTTSNGTLTCDVTVHYTVGTNGPNHVVLNPTTAHNATAVKCHLVTPIITFTAHVSNVGFGQLTINTWGTGSAASTLTANITGTPLHCTLHGNIPFQAATNGGSTINVETANTLTVTGVFCPPTAEAHGSFTLESGGVAITSHFVPTG